MTEHVRMADRFKYAVIERERRFLIAAIPEGVTRAVGIVDNYINGTRLGLRRTPAADGTIQRKLGQKVRLGTGASEMACTTLYLDAEERELLRTLPSRQLRKIPHIVERDGVVVAIDE